MADYEIVERLKKAERECAQVVAGYWTKDQVQRLSTEAAATIVALAEALDGLTQAMLNVRKDPNEAAVGMALANALSALSRLKGDSHAG